VTAPGTDAKARKRPFTAMRYLFESTSAPAMWKNYPMRGLIPLALGLWLVVPGARSDDWAQGLESYDGVR